MTIDTGFLAVEGATSAGAVTFWTLAATDHAALHQAWTAAGFDPAELPSLPSPQVALRRAVGKLNSPGKRESKSLKSGGYVIKSLFAVEEGRDVDWTTELKARINEFGWLVCDPVDHPLAAALAEAYRAALNELTTEDISERLLIPTLARLDRVCLRPDTGGIYYIPPRHTAEWEARATTIMSAGGCKIYTIAAVSVEDVAQVVLDGITAEAQSETARLRKAIHANLGETALRNRQTEALALEAKLERYEALLGASLASVRAQAATVRADLARAALAAAASDESDVAAMIDALA